MVTKTRTSTREKLLDAARAIVGRQGFAATSIDQIIEEVGVTKGAFFYHFKSKSELARALLERFAAADAEILRSSMERAEKLSDDPVQQVLIFVGLMVEIAEHLDTTANPNCLFATFAFESGLFEEGTTRILSEAMLAWRTALGGKLRAAAESHPPTKEVDLDSLADMLTVVFEGSFMLARAASSPNIFAHQIRHYRNYLQYLFDG